MYRIFLLLLMPLQDLATASTLPVLLQSLATSADDFARAEAAAAQLAAAAASSAAQLATAYQPMAEAMTQCLLQQQVVAVTPQQQQRQSPQLPVELLEAAVIRAAAAAMATHQEVEEAAQQPLHLSSTDSFTGTLDCTQSGISSLHIQRACAVLQQQLEVLGWTVGSKSEAAQTHSSSGSLSSSTNTARRQQPAGYQLASLLPLIPTTVAVVIADANLAAALAAVYEAAAAAGVPASNIQLCSKSSSSSSNISYADHITEPSTVVCKSKWLVLLLEEASHEAVAAAARWLAGAMHCATTLSAQEDAHASSSRAGTSTDRVSSRHSSSSSSAGSAPRVWVALPMKLAAALSEAAGNTCLLWTPSNCSSPTSPSRSLDVDASTRHAAGRVMGAILQLQVCGPLQCESLPAVQNLLQPLLVAALAAQQQLLSIQREGQGSEPGYVLADLTGPADLLHLQLVLQQVATATAAAAGLLTTSPVQQDSGFNSSSSSSGVRSAKFCKPLKHPTRLPLDLQQLQQLLQWAVFGPSSSSRTGWEMSQQALQESFTAATLGVRERRSGGASGFSEVQVLGSCIADAAEDAARQQQVVQEQMQHQMHLLGVHSSADDGVFGGGCCGSGMTAADTEHVERGSGDAVSAERGTGRHTTSGAPAAGRLGAASSCSSCSSREASEVDAVEAAAADDHDGAKMEDSNASGCLLPLGLSLSSEVLWALLLQRMTG
jgi:hypothetical protein